MLRSGMMSLLAAVALMSSGVLGLAQDKTSRTAEVALGGTAQLGSFANVKPDCSPGPLAEVKVLTPPKTGVVVVSRRQGKLGPATRCPNAEATAQVVLYRAKPTAGQDEVAFQVTLPTGRVVIHNVVIAVKDKPGTATGAKSDEL